MENLQKPLDSAPAFPSLIEQFFGSKGSVPPSSTAKISSIFLHPRAEVVGKSSDIPEMVAESSQRSQDSAEELAKMKEDASNGRRRSTMIEPCPLSSSSYYGSSSLYYGAREYVFTRSSNVPSPGSSPEFKRDDNDRHGNDDSGNWWEDFDHPGSLYY